MKKKMEQNAPLYIIIDPGCLHFGNCVSPLHWSRWLLHVIFSRIYFQIDWKACFTCPVCLWFCSLFCSFQRAQFSKHYRNYQTPHWSHCGDATQSKKSCFPQFQQTQSWLKEYQPHYTSKRISSLSETWKNKTKKT